MRAYVLAVLFAVGAGLSPWLQPLNAAPKNKTSDMARVAVLRYSDKTNTSNFGYMPDSLQEAISKSLHKKFEFVDADTKKLEPLIASVTKENKGVFGAREAAKVCRLADVDILIYGDFTYLTEQDKIQINTSISLGSSDALRTLASVENRVDSTIFQAADKVATIIVAEITKVAAEQQEAAGKTTKETKTEAGKTQLAKTEKKKTWAEINYSLELGLGVNTPLISREKLNGEIKDILLPFASLSGQYRFMDRIHLGLFLSFADLETKGQFEVVDDPFAPPHDQSFDNTVGVLLRYLVFSPTVGYFFDLTPSWRLTNQLGVGYYAGVLKRYAYNEPDLTVYNPFVTVRSGIHYMVFSFLAVGIEAGWSMLYDTKPVNTLSAQLAVTGMF